MNIKEEIKKYIELKELSDKWDKELEKSIEKEDFFSKESDMIEKEFDIAYEKYWNQMMVIVNIIKKYTNVDTSTAREMLGQNEERVLYLLSNLK